MNKIYMQSIDLDFIKNYLRIEQEFKDDDLEIEIFMQVAKDYLIKVYQLKIQLKCSKLFSYHYLKVFCQLHL